MKTFLKQYKFANWHFKNSIFILEKYGEWKQFIIKNNN